MKTASRLFVLAALALMTAGLHAETLLLRGTVGKYPVVMELDTNDNSASGSYFYEKYKQDISLRGDIGGQAYHLTSAIYDSDDETADRFELTRIQDAWKGTFMSGGGKALPVELHVVQPGSVPDPGPVLHSTRPFNDYEKLRLSGLTFVPGKKEVVGGKYTIQWFAEPRSKFSMFHIVGGYPETVMGSINSVIDRDFHANVSGYFGCSDGAGGSGADSLSVSRYFLSDRFISYDVASSWSCAGAAHPDFGESGTTFDARTGKELALEDVYWLGKGARPAPESKGWMDYRDKIFGPAMVSLFQRLYPKDMKPEGGDGCDFSDPSIWSFGPWYMTEKGIYVGATFARADRACDNPEWSVIPYGILEKNNPALFGH